MNHELRVELVKRFGTQIEAARRLGIRENRLSYIMRGHVTPNERERRIFQETFGRSVVRRLFKKSVISLDPSSLQSEHRAAG